MDGLLHCEIENGMLFDLFWKAMALRGGKACYWAVFPGHYLAAEVAVRTRLTWIEGGWPGRIAVSGRPRGGEWLEDEIRSWKQSGVQAIVSLLTPEEVATLDLQDESVLCGKHGLDFYSLAVPDRGTPAAPKDASAIVSKIENLLRRGRGVLLHCRVGLGRSAMLAAAVLAAFGIEPDEAFRRIGAARRCVVPDTDEQQKWVMELAHDLRKRAKQHPTA
jgi:protein-tyrosine phosphatase